MGNPTIEIPTITKLFNRSENISLAAGCQIFTPKPKVQQYEMSTGVKGNHNQELTLLPPPRNYLKGFGISSQGGQIAFLDSSLNFVIVILTNTIPIMTPFTNESERASQNINLSEKITEILNEEINR